MTSSLRVKIVSTLPTKPNRQSREMSPASTHRRNIWNALSGVASGCQSVDGGHGASRSIQLKLYVVLVSWYLKVGGVNALYMLPTSLAFIAAICHQPHEYRRRQSKSKLYLTAQPIITTAKAPRNHREIFRFTKSAAVWPTSNQIRVRVITNG